MNCNRISPAFRAAWSRPWPRVVPGCLVFGTVLAMATPSCAQDAASASPTVPTRSLLEMLFAGGPLIIPILLSSFVMLLIAFERMISLRRRRVVPRLFVERFLLQLREGALDRNEALARCEEESSHVARVFAAAVRKWGKPAVEVEQAVLDEGERIANLLRRYLRVMNGVATVSPLLGLLGTVCGMMQSFNVIAASPAQGRSEMLAGGISVALITTAAGLFVAIPSLMFYLFFVGRVDSLVMEIDDHGQDLVNLISFEALEECKTTRISIARRKAA